MGTMEHFAPTIETPAHKLVFVRGQPERAQLDTDAAACQLSFLENRVQFLGGVCPFPVVPEPDVGDDRGASRLLEVGPTGEQHELADVGGQQGTLEEDEAARIETRQVI